MAFQSKGFTVIELMVAVTVLSVVIAIALPSFTEQVRNNRSITVANEFIDTVSFARAQAVSRPARISICASDDQKTCTGDWKDGYIVFIDKKATTDTAVPPEDPDEEDILKVIQITKPDVELTASFGETPTDFIRFTSLGTLARISADPLTVKTKITDCKGNYARSIGITLSGQTTASPLDCSEEL
jgi:type IV fimbrial biogenesis protein FimT